MPAKIKKFVEIEGHLKKIAKNSEILQKLLTLLLTLLFTLSR